MQQDEPADPNDDLSAEVGESSTEAVGASPEPKGGTRELPAGASLERSPTFPRDARLPAELLGASRAHPHSASAGGPHHPGVGAAPVSAPRPARSDVDSRRMIAAAPRTTDAIMGLLIIVATFVSSMMFSLWARDASIAAPAPAPGPPLKDVPGFPSEVAPFELLDDARRLTVRQLFMGFVAEGVRADGTLDLSRKDSELRYSFQDRRGRGPQPYREGGTLPGRTFCGKQSVQATARGLVAKEDEPKVPCSHTELRELPLPSSCQIRDVWKVAQRHKFRLNRPARLEYFRSANGPAFRLVQKDKKTKTLSLVVSARDCQSVLTGKEQRGSVP